MRHLIRMDIIILKTYAYPCIHFSLLHLWSNTVIDFYYLKALTSPRSLGKKSRSGLHSDYGKLPPS